MVISFLLILIGVNACQGQLLGEEGSQVPSHKIWDELLNKYVHKNGIVDYENFQQDSILLGDYLNLVSQNPPDRNQWSREEQLAYWINAYNAFTVKLILDHYPIESIKDLHPFPYIPGINSVWHLEFFEIGGKPASLDQIEHKILRKEFEEPRIHFAINCASYSCPPLRPEAYQAGKLDMQLEHQGLLFINNPKWNIIDREDVKLSSIFKWFKEDFTKNKSLKEFVNQYSENKIKKSQNISFLDYDWSLNDH
ncbi:DUF547 domain-containing protein [Echinicola jeungdonensis]|nr:DUF547 domain-containing protein [Echinicola jeungdonensis]MDN3671023.1 DUF547 domain-containing protein [Echinicola jeungdonensis]